MSPTSRHSAVLAGRALVRLRDGSTYLGHARCDARFVTISGRLRILTSVDGEPAYSYRPLRRRTVPLHLVREIVWQTE